MTSCCPASPAPCPTAAPDLPDSHPLTSEGLHGAMAAYLEHVVVCTGTNDWPSRIEDGVMDGSGTEIGGDGGKTAIQGGRNIAAEFKTLLGRNGTFQNSNFSVIASSLTGTNSGSVYLLPSFKYIPELPDTTSMGRLITDHLLPLDASQDLGGLPPKPAPCAPPPSANTPVFAPTTELETNTLPFIPISSVMVFICGHKNRDLRCGLYGPALQDAFTHELGVKGIQVLHNPPSTAESISVSADAPGPSSTTARVAMISHIGGHKYVGNVIIYIPPEMRGPDGKKHSLAGCGIWYGRVDPEHVNGIVHETIINGRVIEQFFRGGLDACRKIVRL
ncbi:Sucraseferredoxin-like protein [Ceratocystis lukuohia]|uniref:Altered inheritance of mitochondria protein 32 n=1 Tax=Ceratocystis lukuohia TaxID=2019550 RepID=A0ABR4MC75_9PEZI